MWAEEGRNFGSTEDVRSPAPLSLYHFFGNGVTCGRESEAGTAGGMDFGRLWVRKSPWLSAAWRQYIGHVALRTEEGQAELKQKP